MEFYYRDLVVQLQGSQAGHYLNRKTGTRGGPINAVSNVLGLPLESWFRRVVAIIGPPPRTPRRNDMGGGGTAATWVPPRADSGFEDANAFGPIVYFEIANSAVGGSIKHNNALQAKPTLQAAVDKYVKLAEFLDTMGCIVAPILEGEEWAFLKPRIYGAMFVGPIAQSCDEWVEKMKSLLPPNEGWQFHPISGGETERTADGRFCKRRDGVRSRLLSSLPWLRIVADDLDRYFARSFPPDFADRFRRWEQAGRSIDLYGRLGRRRDRVGGDQQVQWLVEGLIPCGMVILFAGPREVGKSTMMLELAVEPQQVVLG